MAPGFISPPGSEFGPCLDACKHIDCAATRAMAAWTCTYCNSPIGYERGFYDLATHPNHLYVHSSCHEAAQEKI